MHLNDTGKDPVTPKSTPSSGYRLSNHLFNPLRRVRVAVSALCAQPAPAFRAMVLGAAGLTAIVATGGTWTAYHIEHAAAAPLAPPKAPPAAPKAEKKSRRHAFLASSLHGIASWYGDMWQGRRTASGEIFDDAKMTACHKTLPFGTVVRVTDKRTLRSVVVKINDRGSLFPGRVIDLSSAAAKELGMLRHGLDQVRVEVVGRAPIRPAPVEVAQARSDRDAHSGDE